MELEIKSWGLSALARESLLEERVAEAQKPELEKS